MKVLSYICIHAIFSRGVLCFSPQSVGVHVLPHKTCSVLTSSSLSMSAISDAEEMLRKAKELRAQAEAEESNLHHTLLQKKNAQDEESDRIIDEILPSDLPPGQEGVFQVADALSEKRLSASCLVKVVKRLHEREIAAKGLAHVESSIHHTHVKFEKVSKTDDDELKRVGGLIQVLIDAAAVLDDRVRTENEEKGRVKHHVDREHWSSGELSQKLSDKVHFLGREHDEQFKSRLEEYYEAARKDKKHKKDGKDGSTPAP